MKTSALALTLGMAATLAGTGAFAATSTGQINFTGNVNANTCPVIPVIPGAPGKRAHRPEVSLCSDRLGDPTSAILVGFIDVGRHNVFHIRLNPPFKPCDRECARSIRQCYVF